MRKIVRDNYGVVEGRIMFKLIGLVDVFVNSIYVRYIEFNM